MMQRTQVTFGRENRRTACFSRRVIPHSAHTRGTDRDRRVRRRERNSVRFP